MMIKLGWDDVHAILVREAAPQLAQIYNFESPHLVHIGAKARVLPMPGFN